MLLILSSYTISRYFHVRIIIALLYEGHGILTLPHILQDPVLLVIWLHIISRLHPLWRICQSSHRPTVSSSLLQEKVLWGNIILYYSLAQTFCISKRIICWDGWLKSRPHPRGFPLLVLAFWKFPSRRGFVSVRHWETHSTQALLGTLQCILQLQQEGKTALRQGDDHMEGALGRPG